MEVVLADMVPRPMASRRGSKGNGVSWDDWGLKGHHLRKVPVAKFKQNIYAVSLQALYSMLIH